MVELEKREEARRMVPSPPKVATMSVFSARRERCGDLISPFEDGPVEESYE